MVVRTKLLCLRVYRSTFSTTLTTTPHYAAHLPHHSYILDEPLLNALHTYLSSQQRDRFPRYRMFVAAKPKHNCSLSRLLANCIEMAKPLATVGVLSIGDMGLGVAKLLMAHNFSVVTNITGRRYADARLFLALLSVLTKEMTPLVCVLLCTASFFV